MRKKKLWSLSLSPLSSARSTDVQGRKPKRDGINMRAPCARMCCSGPSASSMLEYLSRLRCLHHYWRPCFEMASGTDSCFRPSSYKCIVHTVSIEARTHVGATSAVLQTPSPLRLRFPLFSIITLERTDKHTHIIRVDSMILALVHNIFSMAPMSFRSLHSASS